MRFSCESVSVIAVLVLILLRTSPCRAAVPMAADANHFSVGDTNLDVEFMMDSEFSRMLAAAGSTNAFDSLDESKAVFNCGRGKGYCLPPPNNKDCRGTYCRTRNV
ncbi:hypothetical protein MANES_01G101700v8 [Manihot esculenta]|uniref:Uncharacterized protein n=1 Tax=Manihot esculenta TaxID=3983 RepID=A0ACB7ID46_MANES|nr:hypothetical protein MANES_01G101700v8 [Manihot esculenta]